MPPNFIHSLDATHMLMCAARCRDDDVTFASVHDSYWSHASSIDQLSKNIRETFIELHSRDIIGDVRKEVSLHFLSIRNDHPALIVFSRLVQFLERYKDHVLPVKSARDVYLAVRRKKPSAKAEPEAEVAEVEDVAEDAEGQEASVAKRSTRGTAFVNFEGESKEKIEIGTRQFVRFTDSLPLTPTKGTFDVNNIRESPYFFS